MIAFIAPLRFVSEAAAACGKDTDCKGDRICDAGVCRDPADVAPPVEGEFEFGADPKGTIEVETPDDRRSTEVDARYSEATIRRAKEFARAAKRGQIMGNSFAIPGGVLSLVGAVGGSAGGGTEFFVPGGVGIAALAVGGPLAAAGGSAGRDGLAKLGGEPVGDGLRVAGWIGYGASMLLGVGALASGVEKIQDSCDDWDGYTCPRIDALQGQVGTLGVASSLLGLSGDLLLAADAGQARRALDERIDEVAAVSEVEGPPAGEGPERASGDRARSASAEPTFLSAQAFVAPVVGGVSLGLTGTF